MARPLVLSALGISVYNTFLYIAAQTTTALNIVMLQSAMPVLIVGFTFLFFRERITARQALGVLRALDRDVPGGVSPGAPRRAR